MGIRTGPLSRDVLDEARALLARGCAFDEADVVAEEKLFGPSPAGLEGAAVGAWLGPRLVGVAAVGGPFLRLLVVDPEARRRGVGSELLAECEDRARGAGHATLRAGGQPGNYLAPGVDARDAETLAWLDARGFVRTGEAMNLTVRLEGNDRVTPARARALAEEAGARGYVIRRARGADGDALLRLVEERFSRGWAFEVSRALESDPPSVHLAVGNGEVASFAAHDGNNRGLGWFGPAGTFEEHRGKGLGTALLIPCLLDIRSARRTRAEIAWIGPREFYEKGCGAEPGRRFVRLEKAL